MYVTQQNTDKQDHFDVCLPPKDAGMFLNQLNIQKPNLRQMLTGRVNAAMQRFGESSWSRWREELRASPGQRSWVTVAEPHIIGMHAQALLFKQINIFKHSCKHCVSIILKFSLPHPFLCMTPSGYLEPFLMLWQRHSWCQVSGQV